MLKREESWHKGVYDWVVKEIGFMRSNQQERCNVIDTFNDAEIRN